jgi:hypothetical protein
MPPPSAEKLLVVFPVTVEFLSSRLPLIYIPPPSPKPTPRFVLLPTIDEFTISIAPFA